MPASNRETERCDCGGGAHWHEGSVPGTSEIARSNRAAEKRHSLHPQASCAGRSTASASGVNGVSTTQSESSSVGWHACSTDGRVHADARSATSAPVPPLNPVASAWRGWRSVRQLAWGSERAPISSAVLPSNQNRCASTPHSLRAGGPTGLTVRPGGLAGRGLWTRCEPCCWAHWPTLASWQAPEIC